MWADIKWIYSASLRFAIALPLLFLIPALAEFAQHVVEVHLGMYDSLPAARAVADDRMRLGFGYAKTLAILLPGYWFVRFMAWDDAALARRLEMPAIGLWLVLFVLSAAVQALTLFGPPLGEMLGLAGKNAQIARSSVTVLASLAGVYFIAWMIAWPLGNTACGPLRSVRIMIGSFWRSVGYTLAGVVPPTLAHYALGLGAIGLRPWVYWPMLAIDAIVVGFLGLAMAGSSFVAARHAARRKGFALIPWEPGRVSHLRPVTPGPGE